MFQKLLLGLFCLLCISSIASERTTPFRYAMHGEWTAFQGGIFPLRLYSMYAPVYGLSIDGVIVIQEKIYGLSLAPLGSYANDLYGLSVGLFNSVKNQHGLLLGGVNLCADNAGVMLGIVNGGRVAAVPTKGGVQIGLYNAAEYGLQVGLLNYNTTSQIPWMVLFNYSGPALTRAE